MYFNWYGEENCYRKINSHGHVMGYCYHPEISYYSVYWLQLHYKTLNIHLLSLNVYRIAALCLLNKKRQLYILPHVWEILPTSGATYRIAGFVWKHRMMIPIIKRAHNPILYRTPTSLRENFAVSGLVMRLWAYSRHMGELCLSQGGSFCSVLRLLLCPCDSLLKLGYSPSGFSPRYNEGRSGEAVYRDFQVI